MSTAQTFPQSQMPMVDPGTGVLTRPWYEFMLALWRRTGRTDGDNANDLMVPGLMTSGDAPSSPQVMFVDLGGGGSVGGGSASCDLTTETLFSIAMGGSGGGVNRVTGVDGITAFPTTGSVTVGLTPIGSGVVLGNISGVIAPPTAITGTQLTTILDWFTPTLKGLVPPPGVALPTAYLNAAGYWSTPAGGVTSITGADGVYANLSGTDYTIGLQPIPANSFLANLTAGTASPIPHNMPVLSADAGPYILLNGGTTPSIGNVSFSVDYGTSGNKVAILDGINTWGNKQTFNDGWVSINGSIPAPPNISILPVENPFHTLTSFLVSTDASSGNTREYMGRFFFNSNKGSAVGSPFRDKVCLNTTIIGNVGTGDIWSFYPIMDCNPGTGNYNAQCLECDINNFNQNTGSTQGPAGLGAPITNGISITGSSTFTSTTALLITGANVPNWYRGISLAGNQVVYASFQDSTLSNICLDIRGIHTYAFDTRNMLAGNPIRIGSQQSILYRNPSDTADLTAITSDGFGNMFMGVGVPGVFCGTGLYPSADNAFPCGQGTHRWTSVWAVNGTIQTSDPSLKTDICDLPPALDIVHAISPKRFRWIDGGMDEVQETQECCEQASELQETLVDAVDIIDGTPVPVKRPHVSRVELWDEVQMRDEHGELLWHEFPEKGLKVPQTHRVPRMETSTKEVTVRRSRPGRRVHWGFMAPDVQAAMAERGLDFGGYVKAEDGTESLRPDQMIPILWKAVQELSAELQAMKEQMQ